MLVFDRPKQGPSHHLRALRAEPRRAVEEVRLVAAVRLHLEGVAHRSLAKENLCLHDPSLCLVQVIVTVLMCRMHLARPSWVAKLVPRVLWDCAPSYISKTWKDIRQGLVISYSIVVVQDLVVLMDSCTMSMTGKCDLHYLLVSAVQPYV